MIDWFMLQITSVCTAATAPNGQLAKISPALPLRVS